MSTADQGRGLDHESESPLPPPMREGAEALSFLGPSQISHLPPLFSGAPGFQVLRSRCHSQLRQIKCKACASVHGVSVGPPSHPTLLPRRSSSKCLSPLEFSSHPGSDLRVNPRYPPAARAKEIPQSRTRCPCEPLPEPPSRATSPPDDPDYLSGVSSGGKQESDIEFQVSNAAARGEAAHS